METTQTFEQWFERADQALPVLTETARYVVVGMGLLLWLAGGRLLKTACVFGGLMLGMILGGLSLGFVESTGLAIGLMVGLGLLGALGALLMFRAWVSMAAALMFAIAAPAAVLVWQGVPPEQLSADTQEAAAQLQSRYDIASSQLSDQAKLQVQQLIQSGDAASLQEADKLMDQEGAKAWEHARSVVFRNLEDIEVWWRENGTNTQRSVGLAMLIGAGLGFLLGMILPNYAAAMQSAMVGAVLIVIPGRELVMTNLPAAEGLLPTTARGTLLTVGLITVFGIVVQWTLHLRRNDKET